MEIHGPNYGEAARRRHAHPPQPSQRPGQPSAAERLAGTGAPDAEMALQQEAARKQRIAEELRQARLHRAQLFAAQLVSDEARQVAGVMSALPEAPPRVGWRRLWLLDSTTTDGTTTKTGLSRRGTLFQYDTERTVVSRARQHPDTWLDGSGLPASPNPDTYTRVKVTPRPRQMDAQEIIPPGTENLESAVFGWRTKFMKLVSNGAEIYVPTEQQRQELSTALHAILQPPANQ